MTAILKNNYRGLTWLFLMLGLVAAGIAYWQGEVMVERELGALMDVRAKEVRSNLEPQIRTYTEVLHSIRAQFNLQPLLLRRDFQQMYRALSLNTRLPGIHAVGFSRRIPPASRPAFDASLRRELVGNDLGYPTEPGLAEMAEPDSYIIDYLEPITNNHFIVGKDQGAEPSRRAAIERARDSGEMAASGRVRLITQPNVFDGVVFFMPLYRGGTTPPTLEQRRAEFMGVTFIGVRIDEMLHGIFGPKILEDLDVEIYDLQGAAGASSKDSQQTLLFDSGSYYHSPILHAQNPGYPLQRSEQLQIGGDKWHLQVTALPGFQRSTQYWLPLLAGLSAVLLSLLAFVYMRSLDSRRHASEKRARRAESSLQSKEQQLSRISDSIDEILWTIEVPGNRTQFVSAAINQVYGRPPQAFYDNPLLWKECIHPEDLQPMLAAVRRTISSSHGIFQYRILRPDKEIRWVQVKAHFIAGVAPGTGLLDGICTDITEQRRTNEALLRKNRALQAIHACERVIGQSHDVTSLMQGACDVIVASGYRMAWAGIIERNEWVVPAGVAGDHQGYLGSIQDAFLLRPQGKGTIGEALANCRPVVSNRFANDERLAPWRAEALRRGFRAKITLPLIKDDQALGVLNVYAQEEDAFDHDEVELLQSLVNSIAVAVQSQRHRLARQAAEAGLWLRQRAIESCANPIAITSALAPDYPVEYVNPAFEQVTGYAAAEVIGKSLRILCRDDLDQPSLAEIEAAHAQQCARHAEIRNYCKDGSLFWAEIYISPVRNENGAVSHYVLAIYDITASKLHQAELEYQANYDKLTGLANRNLLQDRASQAIARASSHGRQVWMVYLDLDRFKFVNDTMDREAGDALLQMVAQRLQKELRRTDTAARVSGDEFLLLLPEAADEDEVTTTVQSIMQAIEQPLTIRGHDYFLTCSAGIAAYPADGDNTETLVRHADIAMHRAKEMGRNNFQFYTAAMNRRAMERLRLEGDLRHALQRNELLLNYQPQVDLRTGRIVGAEALLRWQHPELGMIPPDRFIRIAEESGQIVPIGTWVMRTACQQNHAWQDAGYGALRIAVNLSGNQFYQPNLIPSIAAILQETGLDAGCLDIELTESLVMHDVGQADGIMRKLKALGVTLSIDDFGTGYSSLSHLKSFPIDVLKVDQSFVRNVTTDPDQAAIARAIITLARSLHLRVIAEGVETADQLAYLRRHHCDEIQGYYFSRPLSAPGFEQLLAEDRHLPGAEEMADSHRQTLLIVDDEKNVAAALTRLLRNEGYRILRAHTADDAFSLLARENIQVILCEQRMQGMTGTEFLSNAKALHPQVIGIMLTGYTAVESIIEATNSGAVFRFHAKPWNDDILRKSVAEAFQYYWHRRVSERIET
ncbi:MAG TPA: hypothetical protein DHV59_11440 [Oxalobacteraceae bacterium]|nr:hypothetical protein [Oxalobacteraceae bacterium]